MRYLRWFVVLTCLIVGLGLSACSRHGSAEQNSEFTSLVILAAKSDPYYLLAEEIAMSESAPLVGSITEALELNPVFMVWVVSPEMLSDQVMVEMGQTLLDHGSFVSLGLISGVRLENARELWLRADQVSMEQIYVVNAANPSAQIYDGFIIDYANPEYTTVPLTLASLQSVLEKADYATFTGHGNQDYWRIDSDTTLKAYSIPALKPGVFSAASCQTFRPWEKGSIAMAFGENGAAAYVGFVYSPNSGFLIGGFRGLPLRYTTQDFPIGHAIQVQQRGTLQGFAKIPFYYLSGDPRIALSDQSPYNLESDLDDGAKRELHFSDAPEGVIPVRIPDGASFSFARIPGVSAAWQNEPFFNARIQMIDVASDKYILFDHQGGDFAVQLRKQPPMLWLVADLLLDSFDDVLIFNQNHDGDVITLFAGALGVMILGWRIWRQLKEPPQTLIGVAPGAGCLVPPILFTCGH